MKMSKESFTTATHHPWEKIVAKYADVYKDILEKKTSFCTGGLQHYLLKGVLY